MATAALEMSALTVYVLNYVLSCIERGEDLEHPMSTLGSMVFASHARKLWLSTNQGSAPK
eukprot:1994471-Amphidinium_carterae.1